MVAEKIIVVKASQEEKNNYSGLYPLYGWVEKQGFKLPIEDLRKSWDKEDPRYEVIYPRGFHIDPDGVHTSLHHTITGIKDNLLVNDIVPCTTSCSCQ